ncbi:transposase [Tsukamurella tyrosinosolvens]|uniref:helix-turn-helix domain-containing protein n=1 Tax=Tsukamurella TaxID=2060 RepID=UPI000E09AC15|nr:MULTISPECIES: helix-turn-helix domain-containing protein [Tsukamurella]MCA4997911.1 transposase [Tsukamurella tyrosinosolvens]RDH13583.1 transposase [Tsukamurella pulmonis]
MNRSAARLGVGTHILYDGESLEVVELDATAGNLQLIAKSHADGGYRRIAAKELSGSERAKIIPPLAEDASTNSIEPASAVLSSLSRQELDEIAKRARHIREVLTGYKAGSSELAAPGEPRPEYAHDTTMTQRYSAKAAELGVGKRTLERWVMGYRSHGEAGLADARKATPSHDHPRVDRRWKEIAIEVMVQHGGLSKPSRTLVIEHTNARAIAKFDGAVELPSRATAFRVLAELERRYPTFRLSTKRNRDIAGRPDGVYGKLRPTRPGEYVLMDTTRLDVFGLDPVTLRWVQIELTVAMDWYTRCVTGLRLTPVSTKSVDVAAVLYEMYRPRPAGENWPAHAVWPEHGLPRSVLVDLSAERTAAGSAGPAIVPETLVVDHGKVYLSQHMMSVCQRMGISVQPARLRTGRDKGPVERFFRTIREDLLQALPGYKGPDIHSRGESPEADAFFYIDELETIIREWIAVVYHHRPHSSLVDPRVPGLRMSPAAMFEHGVARAGYIEAPRDPDFAYEFLKSEWRQILHYGVEIDCRRYNGEGLNGLRNVTSPYSGEARGRWPIYYDPDDITTVYIRRIDDNKWYPLVWEHAPALAMPCSEDGLVYARKLAASKYRYPDDRLAVADLFERWKIGLGTSAVDRRIALRMARASQDFDRMVGEPAVSSLPSVARVLAQSAPTKSDPITSDNSAELSEVIGPAQPSGGDDDEFDLVSADDYYADALEDV